MKNDCAFTIVIPTCDRSDLVLQAIDSALRDLPKNAEVIVVDDGSSAQAADAIERMFGAESRLQVISSPGGVGAAAARNLGVKQSRGRTIFFLDDDDMLVPGYVSAVAKNTASSSTLTWGFSPVLKHGAAGAPELPPLSRVTGTTMKAPAGRQHLSGLGCGFWIKRELFEEISGIDSMLMINEDTEFCIRLLAHGQMPWVSDQPGVSVYRANEGYGSNVASLTRRTQATERADVFAAIITRHQEFLREAPEIEAFLHRRLLKMLAKAGRFTDGLKTASRRGLSKEFFLFLLNWIVYRARLDRRSA